MGDQPAAAGVERPPPAATGYATGKAVGEPAPRAADGAAGDGAADDGAAGEAAEVNAIRPWPALAAELARRQGAATDRMIPFHPDAWPVLRAAAHAGSAAGVLGLAMLAASAWWAGSVDDDALPFGLPVWLAAAAAVLLLAVGLVLLPVEISRWQRALGAVPSTRVPYVALRLNDEWTLVTLDGAGAAQWEVRVRGPVPVIGEVGLPAGCAEGDLVVPVLVDPDGGCAVRIEAWGRTTAADDAQLRRRVGELVGD